MKTYFQNAIFYPCSGLDGLSFRFANQIKPELNIQNHIFVDYSITEINFLNECNNVHGYSVKESIYLAQEDLSPNGWRPEMPPMLNLQHYQETINLWRANQNSFAYLVKFERISEFGSQHGPETMNVIFIKGEAIATYQALIQNWEFNPKIIIIKCAGWGWGMGYEDFRNPGNSLEWIIKHNPFSNDSLILSDEDLAWCNINLTEVIDNNHLTDLKVYEYQQP